MWIGGVRVIVMDDKNRMLMVCQHHEDRDIWMVPGGGIEEGESSLEAAVREVDEETGLDVQIEKLLWHVEEVSERGQRFVNFFLGRMTGGTLELGEDPEFDEAHQVLRDVRFLSRQEIQALDHVIRSICGMKYGMCCPEKIWDMMCLKNVKNVRNK